MSVIYQPTETLPKTSRVAKTYHGPVACAVEWLSPIDARALLDRNVHNRKPKPTETASLIRNILDDRYVLNGETIKVSLSGQLLDGQNRLNAVVAADRGIWTVVVRGLPDVAQDTVDIGAKRSVGDILHLRGEVNATNLAAALAVAWKLDNNGHLHMGATVPSPSAGELIGYLEAHPSMPGSVSRMEQLRKGALRYPTSVGAALYDIMARLDEELTEEFWTALEDGIGMAAGHPALTLRSYLIRDLSNRRRMDQKFRAAITIKAWNALRAGRPVFSLYWRRSGDKPEAFPVIR